MQKMVALNLSEVIEGKPLPFAVYDAECKLLLAAKGQIVSERMRERFKRDNLMAVMDESQRGSSESELEPTPVCPLEVFKQQHARAAPNTRIGFRISRHEQGESYTSWVVGIGERRSLILTIPSVANHQYININEGQTWRFRTFHATLAVRFSGMISKVVFDPFPYFHVDVPASMEMRHVRKMPRAGVCLNATLGLDLPIEGLIVDLCTDGMRIATRKEHALEIGRQCEVTFRLPVLDQSHELTVRATVRNAESTDEAQPDLNFFGFSLETGSSIDRLMLHACVQERIAKELDSFSRILAV